MVSRPVLLRIGILLGIALAAWGLYRLFRPPPPPGRIVVYTAPSGVEVRVGSAFFGTTTDTGLVMTFAEEGEYRLSLSRAGYETDTSTVWIAPDQVLELDVVMQAPGMAYIRGGVFEMGSDSGEYNERPAHQVTLKPFYIDRTEVRVADFSAFRPTYEPPFQGRQMPAGGIAWEEARAYCRAAGKRLPTEAEWERACRGTQSSEYSYGDRYDAGLGRTGRAMGEGPVRVRSFPPGNGGLYEMTGNLWEWCADWYDRDAYRNHEPRNPAGPDQGAQRALRGGAWYSNAHYSRCAHRPGNFQKDRDPSFGFRCVKDVE